MFCGEWKRRVFKEKREGPKKKEFTGISSDTYQQFIVMMKV
jgi:hypothetical protein